MLEFNTLTTLRLPLMSPASLVILMMGVTKLSTDTIATPDSEFMLQIRSFLLKPDLLQTLRPITLATVAGCICRARGGPEILPQEHVAIVRAIARCTGYLSVSMDGHPHTSSSSNGSSSHSGMIHSPRWMGSMDEGDEYTHVSSAPAAAVTSLALAGHVRENDGRGEALRSQDVWQFSSNLLHTQTTKPDVDLDLSSFNGHHPTSGTASSSGSSGGIGSSNGNGATSVKGQRSNGYVDAMTHPSGVSLTREHGSDFSSNFTGSSSNNGSSLIGIEHHHLSPKDLTNLCWATCTLAARTRQYGMVRDGPRLLQRFSTHFKQHSTLYNTPDLLQLLRSYAVLPYILPDTTWLRLHEMRAVQLHAAGRINPEQLLLLHRLYAALQYAAYLLPNALPDSDFDDHFQITGARSGRGAVHRGTTHSAASQLQQATSRHMYI